MSPAVLSLAALVVAIAISFASRAATPMTSRRLGA